MKYYEKSIKHMELLIINNLLKFIVLKDNDQHYK